jgi:acyl-coenzyme A synthetase/AMP-(fatty) acid ligase
MNIINKLRYWARVKPTKIALIQDDIQITYDHLFRLVAVTRNYLEKNIEGERNGFVVVTLDVITDAWIAVLAARWLGYTVVCAKKADSFVFDKVTPIRAVITNQSDNKLERLQAALKDSHQIIELPRTLYLESELKLIKPVQMAPPSRIGGHICYSSGSTGNPKLVEYTEAYEETSSMNRLKAFRIIANSSFHNLGISLSATSGWASHAAAIYSGSTLINNQSDWILDAFFRREVSHIFLNASVINQLIDFSRKLPFRRNDKIVIRVSGGFISFAKIQWLRDNITRNVSTGMGLTEAGGVFLQKVDGPEDVMWMTLHPGAEGFICSADGETLPDGEEGWLAIKLKPHGPDRYLFDDALSGERFRTGYLLTGDLAVKRPDGRFRLLGRISETISYPGGKLPTGPIENEIRETLSRSNVFVFSRQNERYEDEIIVCLEGAAPPADNEVHWLREKFGSISNLVVVALDIFPYLHSGKIDRQTLRRLLLSQKPL